MRKRVAVLLCLLIASVVALAVTRPEVRSFTTPSEAVAAAVLARQRARLWTTERLTRERTRQLHRAIAPPYRTVRYDDRRAREILLLCEEIPAAKALEWGLLNQVVPRAELDEAVDVMCEKLVNKLPECIRYTKQQLNFWRDLSWHLTVGHARDWLSIHNLAPEVHEGIQAFVEKRPVNYEKIRRTDPA